MLRSTKELIGYALAATDGEIGRCRDFLFDDEDWELRYMVADTGTWLPDRKVLVAPHYLADPDWPAKRLPVRLTKEQIERSPALDEHAPVSARAERDLAKYFGLAPVWPFPATAPWGLPKTASETETAIAVADDEAEQRLRSFEEVEGYRVQATDGEIGHVEDMVLDDQEWSIRYLVIDTRQWLPGKKVLIAPDWLDRFDWSDRHAIVDLTRRQIETSPEYDPARPIHRGYEARLHTAFGKRGYWD